jgi:AcrR family transcriptional regulator
MDDKRERAEQARLETAEKILSGAMRVFSAKGFDGATTEEVASAAGVSKGLVFRYFPTKDELLQALIVRWLREAFDYWDHEAWKGEPAQQLGRILDVVIERVCGDPDAHRLYLSLLNQPGRAEAVWKAVLDLKPQVEAYYDRIERLFAELGSSSPALDTKLFQFAMNGMVQTLAAEPVLMERPDLLPIDQLKQRLLAKLIGSEGSP